MVPRQFKKFPRDLVFVFNETEVACCLNHFEGIAEVPNCEVQLGGQGMLSPLTYSLRLVQGCKLADFPYGQLLIDYGPSFFKPGERATGYDAQKGPFKEASLGTKLLLQQKSDDPNTIEVGYWEAVDLQGLSFRHVSDEPAPEVVSDEDEEDHGDEDNSSTDAEPDEKLPQTAQLEMFLVNYYSQKKTAGQGGDVTVRSAKEACYEKFDFAKDHKKFIKRTITRVVEQAEAEGSEETPKKPRPTKSVKEPRTSGTKRRAESSAAKTPSKRQRSSKAPTGSDSEGTPAKARTRKPRLSSVVSDESGGDSAADGGQASGSDDDYEP